MTANLLDWDDELQTSPDEEYQALLNGLRRAQGFGLYFVQCSPFSGGKLIERVQANLTGKTIGVLKFEHAIVDGNVFRRISEFLTNSPVDVLFIQGLENSLFDAEETKKRLAWSNEKASAYTWREVPPVLINLNQQRERFRDSFATCFVFLLPQYAINYIVHRAPDFFDWRSGKANYVSDPDILAQASDRILAEEVGDKAYCGWSEEERQSRILVIQAYLDDPRTLESTKARLFLEQGLLFGASKENTLEIFAYDKAIQLKPDYHQAFYNKGCTLHNLGDMAGAIACYDAALAIKPDYYEALYNKGNALYTWGKRKGTLEKLSEGIACYDAALVIKPNKHEAFYNKGNALYALGDSAGAIACYDAALDIKPDKHEALNNKGLALYALGDSAGAIACYDIALAIKPDYYEALYNKGNALSDLGRQEGSLEKLSEGIACYDDALGIKPDKHEALNNKGNALYAWGRQEGSLEKLSEGIACYDDALAIKTDDHKALYNKAFCYGTLGDVANAVEALEQAIRFYPQCREMAKVGTGFDSIRHDERFQALVEGGEE